jgi:hypothetical protein
MSNDMDTQALMSSEVFCNYLNQEIKRQAQEKIESQNLQETVLKRFGEFQDKVNADPYLKAEFLRLQQRFINEPSYKDTINEDFVNGVMLLRLED